MKIFTLKGLHAAKWSQQKIADALGYTQQAISYRLQQEEMGNSITLIELCGKQLREIGVFTAGATE